MSDMTMLALVAYGTKSVARLKRLKGSEYPGTVVHLNKREVI